MEMVSICRVVAQPEQPSKIVCSRPSATYVEQPAFAERKPAGPATSMVAAVLRSVKTHHVERRCRSNAATEVEIPRARDAAAGIARSLLNRASRHPEIAPARRRLQFVKRVHSAKRRPPSRS